MGTCSTLPQCSASPRCPVKLCRRAGRGNDERGARVDDRQQVRRRGLPVDLSGCVPDHPVPYVRDEFVGLNVAREQLLVCPSDEELRAVLGELEREGVVGDHTLLHGGEEERVLK